MEKTVYAPSIFARKCRLRLANIIVFGKKRLHDRTCPSVEALYKTWKFVS